MSDATATAHTTPVSLPERCPEHADRPVVGTCGRCGKFVCVACQLPNDRAHCFTCAERAAPAVLQGIRGWLVLPMLGLFSQPLRLLSIVIPIYLEARGASWEQISAAGDWLRASVTNVLAFGSLTAYALVLLPAFFGKRRWVPRHMQYYFVAQVMVNVGLRVSDALYFGASAAQGSAHSQRLFMELGWNVALAAAWIAYFEKSVRVRNTFVR